jgi:hypothetical protein
VVRKVEAEAKAVVREVQANLWSVVDAYLWAVVQEVEVEVWAAVR